MARRIFWIQGMTSAGRALVPMFWGAAAFAWTRLPSYAGAYAQDGQSAVPEMLGQILPAGAAGLLLAGMFAAFMSTHDSYLLAWSGVIVRDVISPIKAMRAGSDQQRTGDDTWGGLSSREEIYWTRAIIICLAVLLALFGIFFIDRLPETAMKFMYLTGTIYFAGTVGTVVLGLYWKKANRVGAYCALVLGATGPLNFLVMSFFPELVPEALRGFVGELEPDQLLEPDPRGPGHDRGLAADAEEVPAPPHRLQRHGVIDGIRHLDRDLELRLFAGLRLLLRHRGRRRPAGVRRRGGHDPGHDRPAERAVGTRPRSPLPEG